jgi:hypothetical protein
MLQWCSRNSYVLQLYEEPAAILQIQQSVMEGGSSCAVTSTQNNGHSSASSSTSPNMPNVSNIHEIVAGLSMHSPSQQQGSMMSVEQPASPTGNIPEVISGRNACQEDVISHGEEEPSMSENETPKSALNTKTVSLDTVAPGKVLVPHGVYSVRYPALEVAKEAPVSHIGTLSVAGSAESDLSPDQFPVGSAMKQLCSVSDHAVVSARNEVLISAVEDVNETYDDSSLFNSATQWTARTEDASSFNSTESSKSHTPASSIKNVSSPVAITEQRPQFDPKESVSSVIDCQHEKTNCEQSVVSASKTREDTEYCVALPNIAENVGSYDILVTESQESGNLNLLIQNRYAFSQSSSDSTVSVIPLVSSPLVSSVTPDSAVERSGRKVPELQDKQHGSDSVTHVHESTLNFVSQTALCRNTSETLVSIPESKSVLKDTSVLLPANSYKSETCNRVTESASSPVKAVLVHEVTLPELSVPCQTQAAFMPSHSESASANDGVTSLNTNNHAGASSALGSNARTSENKQTLHRILNEDPTSSLEMFPENQSSIVAINNFPELRSTSSTNVMRTYGPECRETKSQVSAKTVATGTRQRKLATACPPNISSLTKTVTKTVPASADSKKVQCSDSSCKSGSSDLAKGEFVKIRSKVKK